MTDRRKIAAPMTRTRLIGFLAMGVCAIGYVGAGLALWAGKTDQIEMAHAALAAAGLAILGEIGAACLGLTLFKKRKAMLDRLLRRGGTRQTPKSAEV